MALNDTTLENAIASALQTVLEDLDPEATPAGKARSMAQAIAGPVSAYVRSAEVSVTTTISVDDEGLQTTTAAGSPTGPPTGPVVLGGSGSLG